MKRSIQNHSTKEMPKMPIDSPSIALPRDAGDAAAEHAPPPDPKLKDDENPAKAWAIASPRDFDDMSQEMSRLFEGKECEQNWDKRRKAIIKLSRITHGNGPVDYRVYYTSFIKSQLDAILKVVDSLRTNVSAAGLNLLQHIAETLGHGVDFMVDFVAETLITRCCNTSKVKRDPAIATFETIISNATFNKNLVHYVLSASEHKDPNARTAVSSWLAALLTKNGRHCDQVGVVELIEKCIRNGLNDAKPQVRTPMRSTYGTYARLWPERAERLKNNLDVKTQRILETNNPSEPLKITAKRPSIRDLKAAKKKELDAAEIVRPASEQSHRPSIRDIKKAKIREMEAKAAHDSAAPSDRPLVRDEKSSKKRNMEAEVAVRPSSAQSNRIPTRDNKTVRKRDVNGDETVRAISSQTHKPHRRFHILSSAPMRPQRSFVEVKRVAPKPARSLQQLTDGETLTPPQLEDLQISKHVDRKANGLKSETVLAHPFTVSRPEPMTAKTSNMKNSNSKRHPDADSPSASPRKEKEMEVLASTRELLQIEAQQTLGGEEMKVAKPVDTLRKGPASVKPDWTQNEKIVQIHEDETDEIRVTKAHRLTRKRSPQREYAVKEIDQITTKRSSPPPSPPTVLREIDQLNRTLEPVKGQENIRQKYISTESAARRRSVSPNSQNPEKARKQLSRAVEKVRQRSMDDYGYRRLQGLIRHHDTLFQDEERYDELLLALLDTLETANTEKRLPLGRQYENKFQILVTIRLMLVHSPKYCVAYHARALCALIGARRNFESRNHIVGGLEETADDIIAACSPDQILDPVLDMLTLQEDDDAGYRAMSLGLHILSKLAAQMPGNEIRDKGQEERLMRFAAKCLRNENSETRRATTAFCVELRRLVEPEEKYFQFVAGRDEALRSLLTYFIATHPRR